MKPCGCTDAPMGETAMRKGEPEGVFFCFFFKNFFLFSFPSSTMPKTPKRSFFHLFT